MVKSTSAWNKFVLLLWKNWILQWNHKISLCLDLLSPLAFAILLHLLRSTVSPITLNMHKYSPVSIKHFEPENMIQIRKQNVSFELAYSPENSLLEKLIRSAANDLSNDTRITTSAHKNASALELYLKSNNILSGVQFQDKLASIKEYPKHLDFELRFPSELRFNSHGNWMTNNLHGIVEVGPREKESDDGGSPYYIKEGFLPIQRAISEAFIKAASNNSELPEVVVQRFPYPECRIDIMLKVMETILPMMVLMAFIYPVTQIIKNITLEKEKQLKEVMKIMGLKNWIHWTAWFVKGFTTVGISATCIISLWKIKSQDHVAIFTYSNWSALWVFMLVYTSASICFCFMLATFFSRANTAAAMSGLIWFISYMPFLIVLKTYDSISLVVKLCLALFSNTGMALGMKLILQLEMKDEGLQWNNLFTPVSLDDTLTVGYVLITMLVSCVLYLLICLYVEQISPGDFGIPQKWYFPFTKKFWCGETSEKDVSSSDKNRGNTAFESEPSDKKIGVQIKNLRKVFDKTKVAVNGVSMNMYEGEITVLLGHNGAGKTTTISMITGVFPPTSGTAIVNGFDIRTNIASARQSMGFCPQHNVLFDEMTVRQHIIFFSRLKGVKRKEIDYEVDKYLKILELENKRNVASKKLSGGMKRKLSVGTALCGGTKVVLLDEPSSGMDPEARRKLWDLIQIEKRGRTILLTTHFMDEADVLGDRIGIYCAGELKCYGTSFFLKKRFGSGYILICVKKESCKSANVTALLRKHIDGLNIESEIGAELTYSLPEKFTAQFEAMLDDLDKHSEALGLSGYGISITSLEEVFMKVGADTNAPDHSDEPIESSSNAAIKYNPFSSDQSILLKGVRLHANQWMAMFYKKYLYSLRNYIMLIIQLILPVFFVVVSLQKSEMVSTELQPLEIKLKSYGDHLMILMERSLITNNPDLMRISSEYENFVREETSDSNFKVVSVKFEDYILEQYQSKLAEINTNYLAAATFGPRNITAWFNNQPLHTIPLTVNLVHNAMARAYLGKDYHISVSNSPLPFRPKLRAEQSIKVMILSMMIVVCMSFITPMYILFIIKERVSRSKLLQFVGGVRVCIFWLSQIIWDYFTYLLTALVLICTVACFQEENFSTFSELSKYFLLLMFFGLSVLPPTYLIANCFTEPSIGFGRVSILNLCVGVAFYLVKKMTDQMRDVGEKKTKKGFTLFHLYPHYALYSSIDKLSDNLAERTKCEKVCSKMPNLKNCSVDLLCKNRDFCCVKPFFGAEFPGVLPDVAGMIMCFIIFFSIIIIKEYKVCPNVFSLICNICRKCTKPKVVEEEDKYYDNDVKMENFRISEMTKNELVNTNLVLENVTKSYGNFLAVQGISLGVKQSECFGLLGVNGAGKTTTFKMMTGDEKVTSGNAYVKGISLTTNMNKVYKEIGYCPQFDALLDDVTGRETMRIFCLLRGIPWKLIPFVIDEFSRAFGFKKHLDKRTKTYSGGNKRKLSTAIALIGGPSVVYLDEPTSGMDPAARRQLWNVVIRVREAGKSVILTSHGMDECEALCTRLAVMVNGEFKCLGSTQHLKNKFSKGLVLKIKIPKDTKTPMSRRHSINEKDFEKITDFVESVFPQAVLKEHFQGILTYYIPMNSVKWSRIFGIMETQGKKLNIEDYSISQTTLEEIFLEFAKMQREDPRDQAGAKSCRQKVCCCCD